MKLLSKVEKPKKKKSILREYIESFGIALLLALMIKTSVVEAYKIPSGSMEDTLLIVDFLLANKFIYGSRLPIPFTNIHLPALREPKAGDIVIFKYPQDQRVNYIKRCVAVAGEEIQIKDKVLYINGKEFINPPTSKFTDRGILPTGIGNRDNFGPYVVPKGYIFMMGDNRDNSYDSRFWGPLDRKLVLGKAMIIHYSWEPDQNAPAVRRDDVLSIPKNIVYNIVHFPQRVRWNRIGHIIK
ncbi:MAG: signal peptidase I [candidate division Zixibacteria bacterium]|nr:signal peptidase I [candidate division Zixibacteria bacterium]